jgi:hypothetical protein
MRTNLDRWTGVASATALALFLAVPVLAEDEAPDLMPSLVTRGPLSVPPGASISIEVKVQNKGGADSTGTDALLVKSADATITTEDETLDKARVKPLTGRMGDSMFAVFESWEHTFELSAPDTPGSHFYGICVEPGRRQKSEPKCSDPFELKVHN